jgi:hypothetical protein
MHVAAKHCVHPDACVLAERDIAENLSRGIDVAGGGDDRRVAKIGTDHVSSVWLANTGQVAGQHRRRSLANTGPGRWPTPRARSLANTDPGGIVFWLRKTYLVIVCSS